MAPPRAGSSWASATSWRYRCATSVSGSRLTTCASSMPEPSWMRCTARPRPHDTPPGPARGGYWADGLLRIEKTPFYSASALDGGDNVLKVKKNFPLPDPRRRGTSMLRRQRLWLVALAAAAVVSAPTGAWAQDDDDDDMTFEPDDVSKPKDE